ncbi:MAG: hypothetical protein N5P05_000990 [Chroococcopsis gigantea SAG 12.99]|jgi:D-alanyl-D-alanine carboxypeptidase/D-alanyl-D-alanine-endopeptidase (penicillin-binding protein 4)|nr:D-alanyl-D-alanine carboxypeptidase [Chlorogloea purpurea SAG 13.99]MDV2999384.1 hypothetical protein [Chroococcopsis gigantea SAG 12.99]
MNKLSSTLNTLVVLTVSSLTWITPTLASEVLSTNPNVIAPTGPIELHVPPPENGDPADSPPANSPHSCSAQLEAGIDRIVNNAPKQWGILVESIDHRTVYYSHNSDRYFIPASNTKLFTTATALQTLSPESQIKSSSLRSWVTIINQRSNNAYADSLFKYIGGRKTAQSVLGGMGINPNGFRLADGSGLSRRNIATPRALVELLRAMYYAPTRDVFYASLPIAGISGTLKNRMRNTQAEGIVMAKTGTLWGVRALSGYVNHPQYGLLVFSIIANAPTESGQRLVNTIDAIVLQLTRSTSCQEQIN